MATYKVIQDVEAEDKFLGPLTLKQFIFGAASMFFLYLSFFAVTKNWLFLLVVFLPPALVGAFLAIPWSKDQSTELWVLAKLRFRLKPRVRVWDQAGLEELVTITVPKKIEKVFTNGLDQTEVKSRLSALADTIDSRGWAVKNASLSDAYNNAGLNQTQRLIDPAAIPQPVPDIDLNSYTDIMDDGNTVSESFKYMIDQKSQHKREEAVDKINLVRQGLPAEDIQPVFVPPASGAGAASVDEELLAQQLKNNRRARDQVNQHMRQMPSTDSVPTASVPSAGFSVGGGVAVSPPQDQSRGTVQQTDLQQGQTQANGGGLGSAGQPIGQSATQSQPPAQQTDVAQGGAAVTSISDAAILNLANNNDLNVETIARQAKKTKSEDNEVVISLH